MTKAWIEKNLEAVRHLRSTYKLAMELQNDSSDTYSTDYFIIKTMAKRPNMKFKPNNGSYQCPLCTVNDTLCIECPWTMFTNQSCHTCQFWKDSLLKRLKRLNEWESKLMEMRG